MGQLQVEPPEADDLRTFLVGQPTFTTAGGDDGVLVDLTGFGSDDETATGMLVAAVRRGGQTVFVKFTGPKALLREHRAAFEALCNSLDG